MILRVEYLVRKEIHSVVERRVWRPRAPGLSGLLIGRGADGREVGPGRHQRRHRGGQQLLAARGLGDGWDRGLGVIQRPQRVVKVDVWLELDEVWHGEWGGQVRGHRGVLAGDHGRGRGLLLIWGPRLADVIILHNHRHWRALTRPILFQPANVFVIRQYTVATAILKTAHF